MASSEPIRLVHTADLHIGMENFGRWNPATGLHARLEDTLRSLDQVVDFALANAVDVFLIAGDIYQRKDPSPTQQREFARRVRRLLAGGVQVVLLVGNHDMPQRYGDANALDIYGSLELPGVTLLRRPGLVTLKTARGPLQVAGLPHLARSFWLAGQERPPRSLAEAERLQGLALEDVVRSLAAEVRPDVPAVLCAHGSVEGATVGSERELMLGHEVCLPLSALATPAFDYVALGHIHQAQVLGLTPPIVYPGSLDRIDFGEERDDKGFALVTLARGATAFERVGVAVRPFVTLRPDLCEAPDPTEGLLSAIAAADVEGAVVRLAYTLQAERANALDETAVRAALAGAFDVVFRPQLVQGAARARLHELDAGLADHPLAALEQYLSLKPELAELAEAMRERARRLMAEAPPEAAS